MTRYRFDAFTLSPRRRVLLRDGVEQPLIPRYFDLLVYLVERRGEAVHRRDIFEQIWRDVIVSDSALSQAVRTIRRVLGDDPREPRFIRTVSRHGYQFIHTNVVEEEDDETGARPARRSAERGGGGSVDRESVDRASVDRFEPLLERITRVAATEADEEDQREAAEMLHAFGTAEALRRLGTRPGHALGRALLRDTRWDAAEAGAVPILGEPAPIAAARALVRLRLRRAAALAGKRWAAASIGGGLAGLIGGAAGGVLLMAAPGSVASAGVVPVLAAIGGWCGATGGAGVAAGLSAAESVARSLRGVAVIAGGAAGGSLAGYATEWLGRWSLSTLVGVNVQMGGGLEGLTIGAAAGLAYALATPHSEGGLAAPRGRRRLGTALWTAAACGLAALALVQAGRPLVGGTIHAIAEASRSSQATLTPLARMLGEPAFGPLTAALISAGEGALFGAGLALGLTHRPRESRTSDERRSRR